MSLATQAVVERMYAAANSADLDALPDIFAPDFYSHPLGQRGIEPIRIAWSDLFRRYPGMRVVPQRLITRDDRAAIWSLVENVPGRPELMELVRIEDHRIAELWGLSTFTRPA